MAWILAVLLGACSPTAPEPPPAPEPASRHAFEPVPVVPADLEEAVRAAERDLREIARLRSLLGTPPEASGDPIPSDSPDAAIALTMPVDEKPGPMPEDPDSLLLEAMEARAAFLTDWGRPPMRPPDYDEDAVRKGLEELLAKVGGHLYAVDCTPYPCRALGLSPGGVDLDPTPLDLEGATAYSSTRDGLLDWVFLLPAVPTDALEARFVRRMALALHADREAARDRARRGLH